MAGLASGVSGAVCCLVGKQLFPPLEEYARRLELVTTECEFTNTTGFNMSSLDITTSSYCKIIHSLLLPIQVFRIIKSYVSYAHITLFA